ncbi:MAG TPA: Lrp/AsnC family transcriptional regulator [Armatimonadota bacterium]|jgi:DNA-binding Lrp family transcriptional regulator
MIAPRDWRVLTALQGGLPLVERPFAALAAQADLPEAEFLQRARDLQARGILRRLGARIRHQEAGINGNLLVVWQVPAERLEAVGARFASELAVSHCYQRPPFEDFPYNLYTMIHAREVAEAEQIVARLAREADLPTHLVLRTVCELKKTAPIYYPPEADHAD